MIKNNTIEVIKKHNLRLVKALGQNFLTDDSVVKNIVDAAEIDSDTLVIEIGPGVGSMTGELAQRAAGVAAVEIDKHLIPALNDNLSEYSNVSIINQDIMKTDIDLLILEHKAKYSATKVKVVANLPYYITTPIIMKFLEDVSGVDSMVFMVQREVAARMVSGPGTKDYGALSIAVQFYSKPRIAFEVPPHCFVPQPEVHSTIICLDVLTEPPVDIISQQTFFKLVKASFGQRRKTLLNGLTNSGFFNQNKEEMRDILISLGLDENIRGERLTLAQFALLANALM